jgi:hypothetical protein
MVNNGKDKSRMDGHLHYDNSNNNNNNNNNYVVVFTCKNHPYNKYFHFLRNKCQKVAFGSLRTLNTSCFNNNNNNNYNIHNHHNYNNNTGNNYVVVFTCKNHLYNRCVHFLRNKYQKVAFGSLHISNTSQFNNNSNNNKSKSYAVVFTCKNHLYNRYFHFLRNKYQKVAFGSLRISNTSRATTCSTPT